MKKLPIIATMLVSLAIAASSMAQLKSTRVICVDPFKASEALRFWYELPGTARASLNAVVIEALRKKPGLRIMERENSFLQAQGLESDIQAANGQGKIQQQEKLVAADFILTPELTKFEVSQKPVGLRVGSISAGKLEYKAEVEVKVRVTRRTGESVGSGSGLGKKSKQGAFSVSVSGLNFGDQNLTGADGVITEAFQLALGKAVEELLAGWQEEPFKAFVATVYPDGKRVALTAGTSSGVEKGMEFDVVSVGEPVRNPVTNEILGEGEITRIGRVRVVEVYEKYCVAEVVEGGAITEKAIVRPRS